MHKLTKYSVRMIYITLQLLFANIPTSIVYPKDRPVDVEGIKVTKDFDHILYSMMAVISFSPSQRCMPTVIWLKHI